MSLIDTISNFSFLGFDHWGYVVIFFAAVFEATPLFGLFVPGMVIVVAGGFMVKLGILDIGDAIAVAALGAIFGDLIGYFLGKKYGISFLERYGKYFFFRRKQFEKTKVLMNNHTGKSLIIGRFNSLTRSFAPFIAGSTNTPFSRFLLFNIIGGVTWAVTFILIGFIFGQSIEYSGVGADAKFIKSRTNFGIYKGLKNWLGFDAIARYKLRFNYVKENGYLPIAERFYMGGIGSVRGYESYSISPTVPDTTDASKIRRIGGEYTASNNFELSFPMLPQAKMRLVTYLDWGYIGTTKDSRDDYITQNLSRGGFGAGVEWFSPVGPVQLMFSKPLASKAGDKTSVFEFTMGQRF